MKLHIIAAALPPQLDGIGDYTACLAAEMAHTADVTVLTGAVSPTPIPGARVETAFSADVPMSVRGVLPFVAAGKPDWVLLQYNPFSYGRWGLNLHLPEAMRGLRRVSPATRLAVMVHEPFVPLTTPQFVVMSTWQRWQLWRLGQSADIVFFSIEAWQRRFARWFLGKPMVHLPVGSNVPRVPITRQEARARLGIADETVVLGLFGNAGSGRMLDRAKDALAALQAAGVPAQLLYVGPHSDAICASIGSAEIISGGPFPAEEVSRRLSAMDIYLAAYVDGVSTRRGAFMAALQHGLATVATIGPATGASIKEQDSRALLLAGVYEREAFSLSVRQLAADVLYRDELGHAAEVFYQAQFSWQSVSRKLISTFYES